MASMTRADAETFLAAPHVAMISLERTSRAPLLVPIWYRYHGGDELGLWMDGESFKVRRLRRLGRLSLCVQDDRRRPYRYVSIEGRVTSIAPIDYAGELVPLVARYLDTEDQRRYLEELGGADGIRGDVYVRVAITHWQAQDLGS